MRIAPVNVHEAPQEIKAFIFEMLYADWGVEHDLDNWYHDEQGGVFLVGHEDGVLQGVVRLMPPQPGIEHARQIRQVVVARSAQGTGVGTVLMEEAFSRARDEDATFVWLEARELAYGFYQRLGFVPHGESFPSKLTGIEHTAMKRPLY